MPNKKNYKIIPYTDIHFIFDEMVSQPSSQNIYDIIKDYIKNNFRAETRYAILLKKNDRYQLYIYTQARRTDKTDKTECVDITIPNKIPLVHSSTSLEGLMLLKSLNNEIVNIFDFYKTITLGKISLALPAVPPTENYIYFNFFDTHTSPHSYKKKIDTVKKQFHQPLDYPFHHFQILDKKKYLTKLKNDIHSRLCKKEFSSSTTIIFDSHCGAGRSYLTGEKHTDLGLRCPKWEIKQLLLILNEFKFSSIVFDLYTCFGGKYNGLDASFAAQFNEELINYGYDNFSIKASIQSVAFNCDESWILCQSPSLTVQYGFLTLPLITFASLANTEHYIKISDLPNYSALIFPSPYQQAVNALKKWAKHIVDQSKMTLKYVETHQQLKEMWVKFKAFEEALENTPARPTLFSGLFKTAFNHYAEELNTICETHLTAQKTPDFSLALEELEKKRATLRQKIDCITQLQKIKKLSLQPSIFKRPENIFFRHILKQANNGLMTPEEALAKINEHKNQIKTATGIVKENPHKIEKRKLLS